MRSKGRLRFIRSFLPLGVRSKGRLRFGKVIPTFWCEVKRGGLRFDKVIPTFRCEVKGEG